MSTRQEPCGWTPDVSACRSGPCCPDVDAPANATVKAIAEQLATNLLWRLTGMRFGCCEIKVRPCKPRTCDPLTLVDIIYFDQRRFGQGSTNLGVFNFSPTLIDGQVFNIACGCPTGCCTCHSTCEVRLPGPVCSITSVQIGADIVPPSAYQLYSDGTLVFLDGENCPPCQDYNKDLGEVGTWSVTYTIGEPVPDELNFAAGLYACELAKSILGEACALPQRVQSVARQGMQIAFVDPIILAEAGLTGIPIVDQIIRAFNPSKLAQASYVWSPDLPKVRRETP